MQTVVVDLERIAATDYHTGGEPFRIVAEPPVALPGDTVADRRVRAMADPAVQHLRRVLTFAMRGTRLGRTGRRQRTR